MPMEIAIYPEKGVLYADHVGNVRFQELANAYESYLRHPEVGKIKYAINDLRRMNDLKVLQESMSLVAERIKADMAAVSALEKMGILVRSVVGYSEAKEYAKNYAPEFCRVFTNAQDMLDWMELEFEFDEIAQGVNTR